MQEFAAGKFHGVPFAKILTENTDADGTGDANKRRFLG
jgi:hypothetical protein